MKYEYYGWFGFCPVYVAEPQSDCPSIVAVKEWLEPVLDFNVWLQELAIGACTLVNPYWEPTWKIRLSGKLDAPFYC